MSQHRITCRFVFSGFRDKLLALLAEVSDVAEVPLDGLKELTDALVHCSVACSSVHNILVELNARSPTRKASSCQAFFGCAKAANAQSTTIFPSHPERVDVSDCRFASAQLSSADVRAVAEAPSAAVACGRKRSAPGHHYVKLSRERSPKESSPQLERKLPVGISQNSVCFAIDVCFHCLRIKCSEETLEDARSCLAGIHEIKMRVQEHVKGGMPVFVAMQTVLAAPTQEAFPSRVSWAYSLGNRGSSSGNHSSFERALEQWKKQSTISVGRGRPSSIIP